MEKNRKCENNKSKEKRETEIEGELVQKKGGKSLFFFTLLRASLHINRYNVV